jgi:hypothetical protein
MTLCHIQAEPSSELAVSTLVLLVTESSCKNDDLLKRPLGGVLSLYGEEAQPSRCPIKYQA